MIMSWTALGIQNFVAIACLTTLCHSARSVAFHLSVCRSSLHQSVISVHSRHGLPFRALPSITPNTMAFNIRASFIRQMWPKNWEFSLYYDLNYFFVGSNALFHFFIPDFLLPLDAQNSPVTLHFMLTYKLP